MARKRSTGRRTTHRRRRRSSGIGGGRKLAGIVTMDLLQTAGIAATAMVATSIAADKLPIASLKAGNGRILGKALIAGVGGTLLARFAGAKIGSAFALGGLASVGLDLYNKFSGRQAQIAGLGAYVPGAGVTYSPYPQLTAGVSGLGEFDDVYDDADVAGFISYG